METPEEHLVKHLALTDGCQRILSLSKPTLCEEIDWDYLVQLSVAQKVAPIASMNLAKLKGHMDHVPDEKIAPLKMAFHVTRARNIRLFHELAQVVKQFNGVGVKMLLLKGADLALNVYRSPALRSMQDIDILIRKDQLPQAKQALISRGYTLATGVYSVADQDNEKLGCEWAFYKGDSLIELHWTVVDSFMPFALDAEELWGGARAVWLNGIATAALAPEMLLFHLALHQYKHGWPHLRAVADVHEVVRTFGRSIDWLRLLHLANAGHASRVLYHTLMLSAALFGTGLPPDFMRRLEDAARVGVLWRRWHHSSRSVRRLGRLGRVNQFMTATAPIVSPSR